MISKCTAAARLMSQKAGAVLTCNSSCTAATTSCRGWGSSLNRRRGQSSCSCRGGRWSSRHRAGSQGIGKRACAVVACSGDGAADARVVGRAEAVQVGQAARQAHGQGWGAVCWDLAAQGLKWASMQVNGAGHNHVQHGVNHDQYMPMCWQARMALPAVLELACAAEDSRGLPVQSLREAARELVAVQVHPLHAREASTGPPWRDGPIQLQTSSSAKASMGCMLAQSCTADPLHLHIVSTLGHVLQPACSVLLCMLSSATDCQRHI